MSSKSTADGFSYRDQVAEGTLDALNDAVTIAIEDRDAFAMQITSGLTGTVVAEVSVDDGDTWQATQLIAKADGAASSSIVNPSAGSYDLARTAGCSHARIRCSAYTSGSCDITLRGTETAPAGSAGGGGGGDASEATLQAIESAVDGIEALIDTTNTNTGATTTSLQIMDDWDESDRVKVNLIVGQAGIAAGAGAVGATVPRVTIVTEDKDDNYLWISGTRYILKTAKLSLAAAQTDTSLVADVPSFKIRIVALALMLQGATATTITFNSIDASADTPLVGGVFALAANGGIVLPMNPAGWLQSNNAGEGISVTSGSGVTTSILATYIEVP